MQITPQATAAFPLSAAPDKSRIEWLSVLPDALAFALGLAVARWAGWNTGDLIWSLWLSSFVVGYATILWVIGFPTVAFLFLGWRTRHDSLSSPRQMLVLWAITLFGASFMVAFFTVHFGGFHYVHSQFLISFFPISGPGIGHADWAGKDVYLEILRRYWIFLPAVFLSHRAVFLRTPMTLDPDRLLKSFSGTDRKRAAVLAEPYRNVMRMHGLIFFFFFAHFLHLENFAVYTVVYAVYFFPWRLIRSADATSF
jgi:uncharacterized protein DUF6498